MNLETIFRLNYGDDGDILQEDDTIKVHLKNGEILIGDYQRSDYTSLTLEIDIEFEEVEDMYKLKL